MGDQPHLGRLGVARRSGADARLSALRLRAARACLVLRAPVGILSHQRGVDERRARLADGPDRHARALPGASGARLERGRRRRYRHAPVESVVLLRSWLAAVGRCRDRCDGFGKIQIVAARLFFSACHVDLDFAADRAAGRRHLSVVVADQRHGFRAVCRDPFRRARRGDPLHFWNPSFLAGLAGGKADADLGAGGRSMGRMAAAGASGPFLLRLAVRGRFVLSRRHGGKIALLAGRRPGR